LRAMPAIINHLLRFTGGSSQHSAIGYQHLTAEC
jgi:hypothetical protein